MLWTHLALASRHFVWRLGKYLAWAELVTSSTTILKLIIDLQFEISTVQVILWIYNYVFFRFFYCFFQIFTLP